jgi:TolA-binding protein
MSLTNWLQDIRLQQRALLELNSNNNGLNSGNNTGVHNNNLNNLANANSSNNANLKMNKIVYDFARVNDDINKASLLITNMDQELKALNGEINQLKHIGTKLGYLNKTLISKEEFDQKSPHKNSSVRNEQNNADNNTENGRTHIPERVLDNKLSDNTMPSGIQLDITVPAPEKRKRAKKEPRKEPEVITGDQQIETKVKQSRKKKPEIRVEEISIPEPDLSLEEAPVPKKRGRPKKVVVM